MTSVITHYCICFFFNDPPTTEIYTLSLHDALPISCNHPIRKPGGSRYFNPRFLSACARSARHKERSEEHTSELQSRQYLVCRLLLEKKDSMINAHNATLDQHLDVKPTEYRRLHLQ